LPDVHIQPNAKNVGKVRQEWRLAVLQRNIHGGYPAFKRKWQSYYRNHHQLMPQRELVELFRENCMHEKIGDRLKRAESMAAAWIVLDTLYDDPLQFARDLMVEFQAYPKIKDQEFERLFDYYYMVQYTIDEADKAKGEIFLIAVNINEMSRALPPREEILWREAKRRVEPRDMGPAFAAFVQEHFEWSTTQMQGLRKTTAKPIPAPVEHHRGGEAKYGRSGEARFRKPSGGGPLGTLTPWWYGKVARPGSRHQLLGTLPQNGHILASRARSAVALTHLCIARSSRG
jgi:hypothetical protein